MSEPPELDPPRADTLPRQAHTGFKVETRFFDMGYGGPRAFSDDDGASRIQYLATGPDRQHRKLRPAK
jgi:hypothetical protein